MNRLEDIAYFSIIMAVALVMSAVSFAIFSNYYAENIRSDVVPMAPVAQRYAEQNLAYQRTMDDVVIGWRQCLMDLDVARGLNSRRP